MTLFPKSLAGRMAVVLALALLVAQSINFMLILQARQRVQEERTLATLDRYVSGVERRVTENNPVRSRFEGRRSPRRYRFINVSDTPAAEAFQKNEKLSLILQGKLTEADLNAEGALVAERNVTAGFLRQPAMVISAQLGDGKWLNMNLPPPREDPLRIWPLILQTIVTYLLIMVAVGLMLRQISRPLAHLGQAVRTETGTEAPVPLTEEGPEDVRSLISAYNEMRHRVHRLFNEKDVMLGAIGHDLRTPLTSLRVRVESVADDKLREKMSATIEDMALLLDDILSLSRKGQAAGPLENVSVSGLLDDVVRCFPNAEDKITLQPLPEITVKAYPVLLRQAIRNLIDNALRYGNVAVLSAEIQGEALVIHVEDTGPGMDETRMAQLREPFERGEDSRNRATGGAGLGLALVDRVMAAHFGELNLENRAVGGLRASLIIPVDPA